MGVLGRRKRRRAFRAARLISADARLKPTCSGVANRMARLIFVPFFAFAHGDAPLSVAPGAAPRVPITPDPTVAPAIFSGETSIPASERFVELGSLTGPFCSGIASHPREFVPDGSADRLADRASAGDHREALDKLAVRLARGEAQGKPDRLFRICGSLTATTIRLHGHIVDEYCNCYKITQELSAIVYAGLLLLFGVLFRLTNRSQRLGVARISPYRTGVFGRIQPSRRRTIVNV